MNLNTATGGEAEVRMSGSFSHFRRFLNWLLLKISRRRRVEALLLKSLAENYPKWVDSGLIRKPNNSTPAKPNAVLSGKSPE